MQRLLLRFFWRAGGCEFETTDERGYTRMFFRLICVNQCSSVISKFYLIALAWVEWITRFFVFMNWITNIDSALETREKEGKRLLAIFKGNGDWCRWCNALDGVLKESSALEDYLDQEGIVAAKVGIPPRAEDVDGVRERFGITGIPFIVFYSEEGRVEGTTEYIDDGNAQSYVDWIESVDSSAF